MIAYIDPPPRKLRFLRDNGFNVSREQYEMMKDTVIGEDFKIRAELPTVNALLEYMFHMEQCKNNPEYAEYVKYPANCIDEEIIVTKILLSLHHKD